MIRDWVPECNWEAVLEVLAGRVGYDLTLDERQALFHGLRETDADEARWYDYLFQGRPPVSFRLAHDPGTDIVLLELESTPDIEEVAEIIIGIAQSYQLRNFRSE